MQYRLSRVVIGPALHVMGRPKIVGLENIPPEGPAILASNHLSVIDSMYLPLMIDRPVVFPAKAEYFAARGPLGRLWAAYLRSTNQLQMDREGARSAQATLEAALDLLRAGELFGFYPEGTRSPDGRLYRGRSGIGYLALNSGAPVIPVAMMGTRKMLPAGRATTQADPHRDQDRQADGIRSPGGRAAGQGAAYRRRRGNARDRRAIGQEYVHQYASDVKARLSGEDGGPGE